ncbi:NUDIX hydrolase [Pelagibacteraceae bacterium]|nr:NUDIX hydrolase [Pelagibacteraceae bacterium]
MKNKIKLTARILLINKKFKINQYYHYLKTPNVTIVVPEIKKKFIIVSQKRQPINKVNYEFPSGQIDKNESPVKSAARELFEETGYKSTYSPKRLLDFFPEPGRLSNKNYCFYTKKILKVKKPEKGIKISLVSKNKLLKLIRSKKFNNASHIAAFFLYLLKFKL